MQTTGGFQRNMGQHTHATDRFGPGFQHESRFPPYIFGKSKRIRNKNWELLEIQVLKKMIHNHRELLNSRHTNAMMNARKNLVWKRIAESINALGLHRRSIRELKIKWSNMRLTERRKVRGQYSSTSGPRDGDDDSLDIVDISQSSFESELDVDRSGEQGLYMYMLYAVIIFPVNHLNHYTSIITRTEIRRIKYTLQADYYK